MSTDNSVAPPKKQARTEGSFYSPFIDFMLLGGASLIALPIIMFIFKDETHMAVWLSVFVAISYVVNNPHFAHSYQIFYRGFAQKIRGVGLPKSIHLRYIFSGVLFPLFFVLFYAFAVSVNDVKLIGNSVNIMFFFVGWHYVKQGYGIAIVCSVLKRNFFDQRGKNILLINAYLVWILTWVSGNIALKEGDYLGLAYYSFDLPDRVFNYAMIAALISSIAAAWVFIKKHIATKKDKPFPFNGLVAYFCAIYVWTLLAGINPLCFIAIPAFHSLQYLAVVWRYEYNRYNTIDITQIPMVPKKVLSVLLKCCGRKERVALAIYIFSGVLLGAMGFYGIPMAMQAIAAYIGLDVVSTVKGASVFMLICWVFINVHHYFIDNVIWKKENPEIKQHLFS